MGGHDHNVQVFKEFTPHRLRSSVAGPLTIEPYTAPIGDIRARAEAVVDHHSRPSA